MKRRLPDNAYRDVWLLAITVVVALALKAGAQNTSDIQAGRVTGTQISCGTNQATLRASQRIIEGSGAPPETPQQEREFEQLGFGTKAQREAQARALGVTFVRYVRQEVQRFAGAQAGAVIELQNVGTEQHPHLVAKVNCAQLRQLTQVH